MASVGILQFQSPEIESTCVSSKVNKRTDMGVVVVSLYIHLKAELSTRQVNFSRSVSLASISTSSPFRWFDVFWWLPSLASSVLSRRSCSLCDNCTGLESPSSVYSNLTAGDWTPVWLVLIWCWYLWTQLDTLAPSLRIFNPVLLLFPCSLSFLYHPTPSRTASSPFYIHVSTAFLWRRQVQTSSDRR